MENLPNYISIAFILTTLLTLWLLYKAAHYSKPVIIITLLWLALQVALSMSGFYTITTGVPPRFAFLLVPPVLFIILLFSIKRARTTITGFDVKTLTLLHIVRIPVELVLYSLYLHKVVPEIMTFHGRNFDILIGLSAPVIYYFGFVKKATNRKVVLAWNIIGLLSLVNIVITAVLSGPFAFQKFGFDQPNVALFYFPFVWLPGFIVPVAWFAHLATIRSLIKNNW